jgi:hypothetical protein
MDRIRQTIKWVVYSLLLVNWSFYIFEDWQVAQHTLTAESSILEWMSTFATSLDELAWFGLLLLFEIETYWLSDDPLGAMKRLSFVAARIACYGFLGHTLYAYSLSFYELGQATAISSTGLCDFADQGYSFLRNELYTFIDTGNCNTLSAGGGLFSIGSAFVITDATGLSEARFLGYIDIQDATVWLAVVLVIEYVVLLQEKGISEGLVIKACNWLTIALYGVLVFHAGIWAWKGHWVYAWDEILWIGGFAAIEMNLSEWREDMSVEAAPA